MTPHRTAMLGRDDVVALGRRRYRVAVRRLRDGATVAVQVLSAGAKRQRLLGSVTVDRAGNVALHAWSARSAGRVAAVALAWLRGHPRAVADHARHGAVL